MADDGLAEELIGAPVQFEVVLPTTAEFLQENIAYSRSLRLKEADDRDMRLTIVANGPSAAGAQFRGYSMALNGAINLFPKGHPPTYWCVSDPQGPYEDGRNTPVDFLKRPDRKTTYLVASKCHKAVFDRLNIGQPWWKFWRRPYNVRLWHVTDVEIEGVRRVPCATSVTLTALVLAQRLGFRNIDVYGWDCCFGENGAHHAAYSEMGSTAGEIEVRVGPEDLDARFKTTSTWALEVQEAVGILPLLRWAGVDVKIHGLGFVRARLPEYAATPLLSPTNKESEPCLAG